MILIKIGGQCTDDQELMGHLADDLKELHAKEPEILLVHGGGMVINHLQELYSLKPRFIDGIRQTADKEMPLVDMALAGQINKYIVRLFYSRGIAAWGMCGADAAAITGKSIGQSTEGGISRTGVITHVSTQAVELLWENGFLPILAPPGMDESGGPLNFNADEAALAMAAALKVKHLIFISEAAGVIADGQVLKEIDAAESEKLIADGVITDGMIPKIRSAVNALRQGVGAVCIASYKNRTDINAVVAGKRGTKIILKKDDSG